MSSMLKSTAGDILRHARWAKSLSVRQLSDLSGVSTTTIVKLEKGKQNAQGQKVYALAQALDIEAADLFDEEVSA